VSARIDKNRVETEKLWLKHDSRGLFVEDLKLQRLWTKKPWTRIELNLRSRVYIVKQKG
jgi:hypothetical protein